MNCPDCHAKPGEQHMLGCDFETCPICGGQLLNCGHRPDNDERLAWTGQNELSKAAEAHGFYCYEDPNGYGNPDMHYGHIPCDKDHPKAHLDLNRVFRELVWSREAHKYVKETA